MIETDIELLAIAESDVQESAGGAMVRARLNKTPSGQWLTCLDDALKTSTRELLGGDPPKYDFLERRQPALAFGVARGKAAAKLEAVAEVVAHANAAARQINEQVASDQRLALEKIEQQRADFAEIKKELLHKK